MNRAPGDGGRVLACSELVLFVSGWIALKWLIRYLGHHTLTAFGWYRMAVAALVLWKV